MIIAKNLNEMISALNEHLNKQSEEFKSYFISPELNSKVFLTGGKPFLFATVKPYITKDVNYFPSSEDETATYIYRKYAGILLCLIPSKFILNNEKVFKNLRKNVYEAFGAMYPITKEYNPYRLNNSYYFCYVVDGNKINVVADPYKGVLILNYFGGDSKLCNDTQNTFEIVGQTILDSITQNKYVSGIQ